MWYQENNKLVRAPVPPSFDFCLKKLEDEDSVLFESISLPSMKAILKNEKKRKVTSQICRPITPKGNDLNFSEDFLSSDTDEVIPSPRNTTKTEELYHKIKHLEELNSKKDQEIQKLQNEILKLKRINSIEKKKTEPNSQSFEEMAVFYKKKYEQLKEQFEKFKENLASDGKIKKYRLRNIRELNLPPTTLR